MCKTPVSTFVSLQEPSIMLLGWKATSKCVTVCSFIAIEGTGNRRLSLESASMLSVEVGQGLMTTRGHEERL